MAHRRTAITLSAAVVLGLVAAPTAGSAPLGPPPVEDAPNGSSAPVSAVSALRAGTADGIETDSVTKPVAPGLELTEFDRFGPAGWIRGDVLTADLAESRLEPRYLNPGSASGPKPLSEQAARAGAVAGVNGDFFDIGVTGAPVGVGMGDGQLLNAPAGGHNQVAAVGDRLGGLMEIFLEAEMTRADGTKTRITDLNAPKVSPEGIALYTPYWGDASRRSAVDGASKVTEVEVTDGVVSRVGDTPVDGPIPQGAVRLLGVGAGADLLASVRQGEPVDVRYAPRTDGALPQVAVGGNKVLLRDGVVQQVDDTALHPRTAAGFSADGKRMWLVTVDGRQADSRGMTERELGEHLKSLGADDAINLDGGGSSTLLAREEGENAAGVHNSPSDGHERLVPNGIGFSVSPGSGRLTGFRVSAGDDRALSGLSRRMEAFGHDETGAPVVATPEWNVSPGGSGRVSDGVFHAGQPGEAQITARLAEAKGEAKISVLGPPVRLGTSTEQVRLAGNGAQGRFQILGYDAEGFGTWIDPADVRLEYDANQVRISPDGDGFLVTALVPLASSVITAHVGDQVTRLGVTVGSEAKPLSPLDTVDGWKASVYPQPVTASLSQVEGREGTPAVGLDYSLTGTTATRAAYVNADPMLDLPAGTQKLGVWVNGDGLGGWLRFTLTDSAGVATTVDLARHVDWQGWRYVEAPIPSGVTGSAKLQRIYVVETDGARQYEGRLAFDDLTVSVAPPVDVPEDTVPDDPTVVQNAALPPGGNRIAVVSDAQFTADDPVGPLVQQARRSLRDAVAAAPDLVVINGDFVDRGTAADFDLARRIIDEELGDRVPWFYVPGNHESYGPGDLSEFSAEFGPAYRVADSRGTRVITLDSSRGTLREGGFEQVRMLRSALDSAVADPGVRSVAVFLHHPIDDPAPADASELSDQKEADLLTRWLTDFERRSGKPAVAVTAHAGAFHASTVDGVPYEVNGNAGKAPALAPEDGGFTGTSLLRIDAREQEPIRWETRPHVDELRLDAPAELAAGKSAGVRSELVQAGRVIPVGYPVSARWEGSPEVHIGPREDAGRDHVMNFDPTTGEVTGLRPGSGELAVIVNGVKRSTRVVVTP
ncbi:phosphodiester glycosidase family protein [Saccharopolyspora taberi]|uniref:phosphodiester glycosidase family protein n=1 Tax=Saccharopolyspora taberi TaxID=60895 RepID=UPI0031D5D502